MSSHIFNTSKREFGKQLIGDRSYVDMAREQLSKFSMGYMGYSTATAALALLARKGLISEEELNGVVELATSVSEQYLDLAVAESAEQDKANDFITEEHRKEAEAVGAAAQKKLNALVEEFVEKGKEKRKYVKPTVKDVGEPVNSCVCGMAESRDTNDPQRPPRFQERASAFFDGLVAKSRPHPVFWEPIDTETLANMQDRAFQEGQLEVRQDIVERFNIDWTDRAHRLWRSNDLTVQSFAAALKIAYEEGFDAGRKQAINDQTRALDASRYSPNESGTDEIKTQDPISDTAEDNKCP